MKLIASLLTAVSLVAGSRAVFPNLPNTQSVYRPVGMIGTVGASGFVISGTGVAIGPNWVLGVAHVGGTVFVQNGVQYPIARKITHRVASGEPADLALYELSSPVPNVSQVLLAPFDGPAGSTRLKNRTAFLVGFGRTGTPRADGLGWSIQSGTEGVRRVAENRIDHAMEMRHNIGTEANPRWKTQQTVVYDLDKPGDSSFSTLGTLINANEGGVAARDSGGGWFVNLNGQFRLVAISVGVGLQEGSTLPNAYYYGGWGFGIHLPAYRQWIFDVTGLAQFAPPPVARRRSALAGATMLACALGARPTLLPA